jgi:hypothetical protein
MSKTTYTIYLIVEKDNDIDLPEQVHSRAVSRHEDMDEAVDECNQMIDELVL